jgi:selenocysteine lyase/cysteine desulfurase
MDKRIFIKTTAMAILAPFFARAARWNNIPVGSNQENNNDYWSSIANDYQSKEGIINLENGYYSIMAKPVMKAYLNDIAKLNEEGSYYMRTNQFTDKWQVAERLADLVGCGKDELIITRNTTESMGIVINGLNWKAGDEAIMAYQDYGAMLDMFKQVEQRFGIVCKKVSVPMLPKSDDEIIAVYSNAITPKTKLLMLSHMINITGQILPVKKICDMAHARGVQVLVDGAHAVAHIPVNIAALGCDYYACSLHKWLGAPLGAGILFVKKNCVQHLWPLFADYEFEPNDIRKLNHTGTHPVAVTIAIHHALDYHLKMGQQRKTERLKFLQLYWINQLKDTPNVYINTPIEANRSCAIANVGIKQLLPGVLAKKLLDEYGIYTAAIDSEQAGVKGVRITPHVYTKTSELDKFVAAIKELAKS